MGVVYEAFDREREMRVALKTLRNLDASSLYRFKREFRSLSDFTHTNIVGLYELVSAQDDWFFTMELVDGVDLVTYVRPDKWTAPKSTSSSSVSPDDDAYATLPTRVGPAIKVSTHQDGTPNPDAPLVISTAPLEFTEMVDERRLRRGLVQLAKALDSLHRAGIVHRDLKPSNVRVTPAGRVVLMDFGIVAETAAGTEDSSGQQVIGTPAYMSPEQAAGEPATAAADWYSFGVVLYVMLTGKLPFSGRRQAVLMAKQTITAPMAANAANNVPEDLAILCADLLERRQEDRPQGHEILSRLGVLIEDGNGGVDVTTLGGLQAFVGREQELQNLHDTYLAMRDGATMVTFCIGVSGMGKSTLIRRFLHELEARRGTKDLPVVLRGRCHERESLPYKALDTVVDNITQFLLGLSGERVQQLLPDDIDLLTRLFPVLRRVPGVQTARPHGGLDPHDLRIRAFATLRELLRRIGAWRPVIVYIDDLQWADRDSLDLLLDVLRVPDSPQLMLLASVRAENIMHEESRSEDVLDMMNLIAKQHRTERISVGPLSDAEQTKLVTELLGNSPVAQALSKQRFSDSGGSPFFLGELVRYLQESDDDASLDGAPKLDDVIWRRVSKLPRTARTLLEVLAVVGEPTSTTALAQAIDMNPVECERAAAVLSVSKLARAARHSRDRFLTTYHDRIRETVCAHLSPERVRGLHQRIAQALERLEQASVDALARHWLAAGDPQQASGYMVAAADAAVAKMAFSRAADLYGAAMALGVQSTNERRQLRRKMADALGTAGRGYEAANAYKEAAKDAPDDDSAADLTRLAADNLLRCGRISEGLEALSVVMSDLGITVKATRSRALMSLVFQRVRVVFRGYKYRRKAVGDIPARDLGRLDTLYAASTSLGMIDHIRGADVQTRHLIAALKFGEEGRICRALAIEAVFRSSFGGRNARVADELSKEAELIARRLGEPYLIAVAQMGVGATAFFNGRSAGAAAAFGEAERILDRDCVGADWERVTARYFRCQSQVQLGELDEVAKSVPKILDDAERRNDVYAGNLFKTQPNMWRWLIADNPEQALVEVEGATEGWPDDQYYIAHHFATIAKAIAMQYQGRYQDVVDHLRAAMDNVRRSMISRIPWSLGELYALLGRCAVAVDDRATVTEAAGYLGKMGYTVADGVAAGLRGAMAAKAGRREEAQRLLMDAIADCETAQFMLYHAGYRYRLGELTPGAEGERLRNEVCEWLASKSVKNPLAMVEYHSPKYIYE